MNAKLQKLLEENLGTITEVIIKDALDSGCDGPKQYLQDVLQYGCQGGTVSSMIRTVDVHKFYDKFYDEIEDLRLELQDEGILGTEHIDQDLKTYYSWLAYEHISYNIYNQIWED